MSLRRVSEGKALIVVPTVDGGGKQVEAPPLEVVEEEAFSDSISQILARDFFPELPKLRAFNEWLDAVQSRDYAKMSEVKAKWRRMGMWSTFLALSPIPLLLPSSVAFRVLTPAFVEGKKRIHSSMVTPVGLRSGLGLETPSGSAKRFKHTETYDAAPHSNDESQLLIDAKTMSLDAFLGKYTSEDDASFSNLLEKEVTEARRVFHDAYEMAAVVHREMVAKGRQVGWKSYDPSHAGVLTIPESLPRTFTPNEMKMGDKAIIPENTRFPESGPSWKHRKATGNLDSHSSASTSEKSGDSPHSSGFKTAFPRSTSGTNTGPTQGDANASGRAQASIGNLDAQLYERILRGRRGEASGTGFLGLEGEGGMRGGAFQNEELDDDSVPRVKGYAMVSMPTLRAGEVDQSPLMTWGEVEGEAVKLDENGLPLENAAFVDDAHRFLSTISTSTSSIAPSAMKRLPEGSGEGDASSSGFRVPDVSDKSAALTQLLTKRRKMMSPNTHRSEQVDGRGAGAGFGSGTPLSSPLVQQRLQMMTPDLQLRSSYNTPTTMSGATSLRGATTTSSARSTPLHTPTNFFE